MNYEEMSDFEINKRVSISLGFTEWHEQYLDCTDRDENVFLVASDCSREALTKDYCNNPSDSWPIIVENNISLELDYGCLAEAYILETYASNNKSDRIVFVDKNPLRAAMICFLKMKDAESKK